MNEIVTYSRRQAAKNWFLHHTKKLTLKTVLYGAVAVIMALIIIPIATYIWFAGDISSKERIMSRNNTGLTLLDDSGQPFYTFNQPKAIRYIPISDIPKVMQQAVIAAEDKDFYQNNGFSISGIGRAFVTNIKSGSIKEGGSTISQELVKIALLNSKRTPLRKYQELVLAIELNRRYSKDDILELYLNSVYFGEGAFGVENAAETYFNKHANQLSLSEASMLTAVLPAPSILSPISNDPAPAQRRQGNVLDAMVGQNYITGALATQAKNQEITYRPQKDTTNNLAVHFALYVKDLLTKQYGEEEIIRSGYKVKTTLNSDWQKYAETVVKNQIANLKYDKATNGAAVVIDPKTGEIKVMVGSEDWQNEEHGKINMAVASRQPGSSFKPIIYATAIDKHIITAATILDDTPRDFGGGYKPLDYDKKSRGPVTVRRALSNSLNIPAVEVMAKVGVESGVAMAKQIGITTLTNTSQYGLSLVLGAAEVPLLDMTNAYATFANGGERNKPIAILDIHNKYNQQIFSFKQEKQRVMDEGTAYIISSILSDNKARSEEFGGALTISRLAAVKTGTTENFRDALTIGYTPSLVVGVWVGNNDNTPMDNVAGSLGAAPIWRLLMQRYLGNTPVEQFKKPSSIVEALACPMGTPTPFPTPLDVNAPTLVPQKPGFTEYFLKGTEAKDSCEVPTQGPLPTREATITQLPSATSIPTQTPLPTSTPYPTQMPFPSVPILSPTGISP